MPSLAKLKKVSKKVLKKYDKLQDVIIFGSYVKGKSRPEDVDIALIMPRYDLGLGYIGKVMREFDDVFGNIDYEVIDPSLIYLDPLFWRIAREGYSVKQGGFVVDAAQLNSMVLYEYSLSSLTKVKKVQFNRAVHNILEKSHLVKGGLLWVPISESEKFQELVDSWKIKCRKTEAVFIGKAGL